MKSPHRPRSRILETLRPQERVAHLRGRSERVKARLLSIPACMLVYRTFRELSNDDATHMAAGVAFYAILSLFPMILGLVALLSMFLDSSSVQTQLLVFFQDYLPGVNDALDTNINAGNSVRRFPRCPQLPRVILERQRGFRRYQQGGKPSLGRTSGPLLRGGQTASHCYGPGSGTALPPVRRSHHFNSVPEPGRSAGGRPHWVP